MQTYNYELGPVKTESRQDAQASLIQGKLIATNYGTATQMASEKAREVSKEKGRVYGLIRIY